MGASVVSRRVGRFHWSREQRMDWEVRNTGFDEGPRWKSTTEALLMAAAKRPTFAE